MKQHITPEQLQELSEEQKERLREWWFKHIKVGDVFIVDGEMKSSYLSRLRQQNALNVIAEVKRKYFWVGSIYKDYTLMKIGEVLKDGDVTIGPNPLLSVGQLIELLIDIDVAAYFQFIVDFHIPRHEGNNELYPIENLVDLIEENKDVVKNAYINKPNDLINALWEAVKGVL